MLAATKLLSRQNFCHDQIVTTIFFYRDKTFVTTNICREEHVFTATEVLSRQAVSAIVFVATKMILVAATPKDSLQLVQQVIKWNRPQNVQQIIYRGSAHLVQRVPMKRQRIPSTPMSLREAADVHSRLPLALPFGNGCMKQLW